MITYQEAKNNFLNGNIADSEIFFMKNRCWLELAYCKMFRGSLDEAKLCFNRIAVNNVRADWGLKLIPFLEGFVVHLPSYFQIRNFLEIDINLLIKSGRADYVECIINGADLFYSCNQESYKFIARVLMFNGFPQVAIHFLNKGRDKTFNDPELHILFAQYHMLNNNVDCAKNSLHDCLTVLPEYYPATAMLKLLS